MAGPKNTSSCAQWYSGRACRVRSVSAISALMTQLTYCQSTASCVSMAPLGVDSVPLV
ncbi:hypothetical protein Y695_03487 [Hydrogenophaga sp. T4]|nr:hypothetical protein Y695_03487 [Hydrogenophaga sp. T4]